MVAGSWCECRPCAGGVCGGQNERVAVVRAWLWVWFIGRTGGKVLVGEQDGSVRITEDAAGTVHYAENMIQREGCRSASERCFMPHRNKM